MLMQAELVYHNREQLLKLPEALRFNSPKVYIRKDAATGSLIISEARPEWDTLWANLQAIGELEELPDLRENCAPDDFRDPFADWEE